MTQILIGYFLLLFDPMPKGFYFDLLPDYFGYAFIIWGFWKIKKVAGEKKDVVSQVKYGIMSSITLFIFSYIICILGMLGKLDNLSVVSSIALYVGADIGEIAVSYYLIKTLQILQENNEFFQIKRMMFLLKIIGFVDICMYISYAKPLTYGTFLVFELIASVMLIVYFLSSALTFREKYVKKKINKSNTGNTNSGIASKANFLKKRKETNNFKNVVNTKKIKNNR